jgi:hypothetical protein
VTVRPDRPDLPGDPVLALIDADEQWERVHSDGPSPISDRQYRSALRAVLGTGAEDPPGGAASAAYLEAYRRGQQDALDRVRQAVTAALWGYE